MRWQGVPKCFVCLQEFNGRLGAAKLEGQPAQGPSMELLSLRVSGTFVECRHVLSYVIARHHTDES